MARMTWSAVASKDRSCNSLIGMPVVPASSKDEFDALLQGAPKFAVVYFWAAWATPCVQMTAVFDKIASFGGPSFISVEAEAVPLVAQKFNVASVPMFSFVKPDGTVFDVVVGAHAPVLVGKVNQYKEGRLPDQAVAPPPPAAVVAPALSAVSHPVSDEPLTDQRMEELRALATTQHIM
jgi:thiol-disulfide isomerase/thioredoxin